MNGRVYDYNLGRFLSVDPLIQGVGNSQGINPYSYIMNNPLAGTDPSGYAIEQKTRVYRQKRSGSRLPGRSSTVRATTITNDETSEVTSKSTETINSDGSYAVTNTNYSNGKESSSYTASGNYKTGASLFGSADLMSLQANSQNEYGSSVTINANWCYQGACRTGIEYSMDNRSAAEVDQAVDDLNDYMLMVGGLASILRTGFKALATRGSKEVAQESTEILRLASPNMVKHHIFNVFRGNSPKSQKYRDFFAKHGIDLDSHTVRISESYHRKVIHQAGNNWTTRWKRWIDANPNASTKEVYQQAGRMMDEYSINHVNIVPYR